MIYLDNSATTEPSETALRAMTEAASVWGNPSSVYKLGLDSKKLLEDCRRRVEKTFGMQKFSRDMVYFTASGTEANNIAMLGCCNAKKHLAKGKTGTVIISAGEHPSVDEPAKLLEKEGYALERIGTRGGELDMDGLKHALEGAKEDGRPVIFAGFMLVNNETGALLNVERFAAAVRAMAPNALIHIDGVQGYLRVPLSLKNVDMYTLSGHKLHGPKGIGALVVRKGVRLLPRQMGGGQERDLRSGTENTPGIAGLHAAIEAMRQADLSALRKKKDALYEAILAAVPEALRNGPALGAPHILNMSFPGVRGEVLLHALEEKGVYVSTGSACSSKKRKVSAVLTAMAMEPDRAESALRFSLSPYTTMDEIAYAAQALGELYPVLRRFRRK